MRKIFSGIGSFLQTPLGILLSVTVVWHIVLYVVGVPFNPIISIVLLVVDVAATFFILDKLTYFFAQFILPIQNPRQRQQIHDRVRWFDSGGRGPALFIKNGRVIEHEGETDRRGAGVIVVDTASAAVLRTDTEIRSVIGPGVNFTEADEYIAGAVDLRSQLQFIGPISKNQLNIYPTQVISPVQQTSGWTRDGFEVSPIISVRFNIKRPLENMPTESGVISQFGFDPISVYNAVMRETVQVSASRNEVMDWKSIPAHLVVNLWRDYIRKFKLTDLFAQENNALRIIEKMMNARLKQKNVIGLDDNGEPTGEWIRSVEFEQLDARGLEVTEIRIHNILLDPALEEQTIQNWKAEWLNAAIREQNQLKEMESLAETASREEAVKEFAKVSSAFFRGKPTMPQKSPFKMLQLLIQPIKDILLTEHSSNPEMEGDLRKLDELWKWLLDNNPDGSPSREAERQR